jgi:predicted AlkP superfamily pyrophosphatase or phosphodiesterase
MKTLYLLLLWPLLCQSETNPATDATTASRAHKVVFMIIDGIPADVIEKTSTPFLDDISGQSGYTRAYVGGEIGGESESPTVSSVGYQSLLTGTWANKHNVWTNDIKAPNYAYWDIFRIARHHKSSLVTAVFSTWQDNRTKLIGDGLEQAGGAKLDYHFDGFELDTKRFPHDLMSNYIRDIDELVTNEAARYIKSQGPDLSWVYLQHTDDIGHRFGDGDNQTEAVKLMDARVGAVWAAITQRQDEHEEDWLLIVTTDHGRDGESGRNHGGQTERERTTWIATNSDRLNENFKNSPAIVDILPSIATYLGLIIPAKIRDQLDGKSFIGSSPVPGPLRRSLN